MVLHASMNYEQDPLTLALTDVEFITKFSFLLAGDEQKKLSDLRGKIIAGTTQSTASLMGETLTSCSGPSRLLPGSSASSNAGQVNTKKRKLTEVEAAMAMFEV